MKATGGTLFKRHISALEPPWRYIISPPFTNGVPQLADLPEYKRMVGEYRVKGIYPRGHVMEFVRPL